MKETHPGSAGCTLEEFIEAQQTRECTLLMWFSEMQEKEKKKKRKYKDDDEDEDDDDDMYHPSQDFNDDSQVDPQFKPTKKELKEADREGDS